VRIFSCSGMLLMDTEGVGSPAAVDTARATADQQATAEMFQVDVAAAMATTCVVVVERMTARDAELVRRLLRDGRCEGRVVVVHNLRDVTDTGTLAKYVAQVARQRLLDDAAPAKGAQSPKLPASDATSEMKQEVAGCVTYLQGVNGTVLQGVAQYFLMCHNCAEGAELNVTTMQLLRDRVLRTPGRAQPLGAALVDAVRRVLPRYYLGADKDTRVELVAEPAAATQAATSATSATGAAEPTMRVVATAPGGGQLRRLVAPWVQPTTNTDRVRFSHRQVAVPEAAPAAANADAGAGADAGATGGLAASWWHVLYLTAPGVTAVTMPALTAVPEGMLVRFRASCAARLQWTAAELAQLATSYNADNCAERDAIQSGETLAAALGALQDETAAPSADVDVQLLVPGLDAVTERSEVWRAVKGGYIVVGIRMT
jgi:hypothetical protein